MKRERGAIVLRVLEVLRRIQATRRWLTAIDFEDMRVCTRTIYRDLKILQQAGFGVEIAGGRRVWNARIARRKGRR